MKTAKPPRFQVYEARDGWRWRLLAGNNRVIASGEAHTRMRDAVRAVQTVIAAASKAKRLSPEQARAVGRDVNSRQGWRVQ